MCILLDEQIDVRMKAALSDFPVFTVLEKGWLGYKNGLLRERLNQEEFQFFVTADKNVPFQQNLAEVKFIIVLLDMPTLLWEHQKQFGPALARLFAVPPRPPVKVVHISIEGLSSGKKVESLQKLLNTEQLCLISSKSLE